MSQTTDAYIWKRCTSKYGIPISIWDWRNDTFNPTRKRDGRPG
jgi:hypothetical protein